VRLSQPILTIPRQLLLLAKQQALPFYRQRFAGVNYLFLRYAKCGAQPGGLARPYQVKHPLRQHAGVRTLPRANSQYLALLIPGEVDERVLALLVAVAFVLVQVEPAIGARVNPDFLRIGCFLASALLALT
jgi:hypothetical protein